MRTNLLQRSFLAMLFLFVLAMPAQTQILSLQDQLVAELEKYDLEYEEVKQALFIRGYDLENMTELTPEQGEDIKEIIAFLIDQKKIEQNSINSLDTLIIDSLDQEVDNTELSDLTESEEEIDNGDDPDALKIYGHHLYKNGQFKVVEPSDDVIIPATYILGVGDEVLVSIFGTNAQLEQDYRIGNDGAILINDNRNRVALSGLTIDQAKNKLIGVFQNFVIFKKDDFSLSVRGNKTVRVDIFGEVNNPGSFVLSSFNSVFSAISAADGPSEFASLRNIRLIRSDGEVRIFDLYEWLNNPQSSSSTYLESGDVLHIPISINRVEILGEVNRPMLYDMNQGEGIMELLEYSGGLRSNAYLENFQLVRLDGISKSALDIGYLDLLKSGRDYTLFNGDIITVSGISEEIENYVRVSGEVRNEGDFERREGMKVAELIQKAGLKASSKTDEVYILRRGNDDKIEIESINLDAVLNDPNNLNNLLLRNKDEIVIYKQSRYQDEEFVIIEGAVRYPDTLYHDASGQLRIRDYINMAGGLRKDAASFAHVNRVNVLNPALKEYKRIDLTRAFNDDNAVDNIVLQPYDSVYIYYQEEFTENRTVKVSGAVNTPGEFEYGEGMTLADAIIIAGGFRLSSATNEIEISRVIIKENQPTTIQLETVKLDRDINELAKSENDVLLRPFDNIFIRDVPEFELQQNVSVEGEVRLPGEYSLIKSNETVFDLVSRAGGTTEEAFLAGAQLYRTEDSLGYIVMRLDEVMKNKASKYNYNLKNGDIITIPEKKDYVTIRGATRAIDAVDRDILGPNNEITVPHHQGKNAKFYIDYYAGGFAPRADKKKIFVRHPNGEVRQLERKILAAKYPEVRAGSVISVGYKEADLFGKKEEDNVDWTKVLGDSVGQAMSILTLILLVQRLD